jgi:small subunit ribosomal protein S20
MHQSQRHIPSPHRRIPWTEPTSFVGFWCDRQLTKIEMLWYIVVSFFLEGFMANRHHSAIKAARQTLKRQERNRSILRRVKTFIKRVDAAIQEKNADTAKSSLREAASELHKAATKGTLHRNTASRWISRLTNRVNAA